MDGVRVGLALGAMVLLLAARPAAGQKEPAGEERERFEVGGYVSSRVESSDAAGRSGIQLRRLVGEAEANLGRFHGEMELELEGRGASGVRVDERELEVEQAWGAYQASPALSIRFGLLLPPVGRLNARNEDYLWDYPRRPLIDRAVPVLPARAAWRALGAGLAGRKLLPGGSRLDLEAYGLGASAREMTIAREGATGVPVARIEPGESPVERGGLAGGAAWRAALATRAGSELAFSGHVGRYVSGNVAAGARAVTLALDGVHRAAGLIVEGEVMYARYGRLEEALEGLAREARPQLPLAGAAQLVAVSPEGLARTRAGGWLDIERPFALAGPGAFKQMLLVPVVRYEQVRLGHAAAAFVDSGAAISSAEWIDAAQEQLSFGLAFRPVRRVVLHAVLEHARSLRGPLLDPELPARAASSLCIGFAAGL